MPWPFGGLTPDEALSRVQQLLKTLRSNCGVYRGILSGTVKADYITEEVLRNLYVARREMAIAALVPGIAAHVAAVRGVTEQSVTSAFTAILAAIDAAITVVYNDIPKNASDVQLIRTIMPDGQQIYRDVAPAATANLRTALQAIETAIG